MQQIIHGRSAAVGGGLWRPLLTLNIEKRRRWCSAFALKCATAAAAQLAKIATTIADDHVMAAAAAAVWVCPFHFISLSTSHLPPHPSSVEQQQQLTLQMPGITSVYIRRSQWRMTMETIDSGGFGGGLKFELIKTMPIEKEKKILTANWWWSKTNQERCGACVCKKKAYWQVPWNHFTKKKAKT